MKVEIEKFEKVFARTGIYNLKLRMEGTDDEVTEMKKVIEDTMTKLLAKQFRGVKNLISIIG